MKNLFAGYAKNIHVTKPSCWLLFLLIGTLFVSCNTAEIRFNNEASDTYELFINGESKGDISPGTFINMSLSEGNYDVKAVQKNGYVLYPTEYKGTFFVKAGVDREWSWGNLLLK